MRPAPRPLWLVACLLVASALACASGDGNDDGSDSGIPTTTLTSSASSSGDATSDSSGTTTSTSSSSSETGCTPGSEGCTCADGQCLGGELICVDDVCQMPSCTPDPDFDEDPANCGSCGNECRTDHFLGARCEGGGCPAALGPCFTESITCDEACAQVGEACVANGCARVGGGSGHTYYGFFNLGSCELAGDLSGPEVDVSCSTPASGDAAYRCCCTDSGSMP